MQGRKIGWRSQREALGFSTSGLGFSQHQLAGPFAPTHGHAASASEFSHRLPLAVSCCVGALGAYTEIKKVAEEKVTLPCHHQLGLQEKGALDIEWLLTDSTGNQKAVSQPRGPRLPSPLCYALASPQPSRVSHWATKGWNCFLPFFKSSLENMFLTNF